jgi:hypothetical protein
MDRPLPPEPRDEPPQRHARIAAFIVAGYVLASLALSAHAIWSSTPGLRIWQ